MLEVLVRTQHDELIPNAELCEEGVDRADLKSATATVVAKVGCGRVIFALRHDQRQRSESIEDLLSRFSTASNVNRYAYFACMAQDKPTALELLARIGTKPEIDRWGSNGRRTFETCKRWASQQ